MAVIGFCNIEFPVIPDFKFAQDFQFLCEKGTYDKLKTGDEITTKKYLRKSTNVLKLMEMLTNILPAEQKGKNCPAMRRYFKALEQIEKFEDRETGSEILKAYSDFFQNRTCVHSDGFEILRCDEGISYGIAADLYGKILRKKDQRERLEGKQKLNEQAKKQEFYLALTDRSVKFYDLYKEFEEKCSEPIDLDYSVADLRRISFKNVNDFRIGIELYRDKIAEAKLQLDIINSKKKVKVVIKNLPPETQVSQIEEELSKSGYEVLKVSQIKKMKTERPSSHFLIQIKKTGLENIMKLKKFLNSDVEVEKYKDRKVVQCFNCQRFGHLSKFCKYESRCVICSLPHNAKDCTVDKKSSPTCANCSMKHTANYFQCLKNPNFTDQ